MRTTNARISAGAYVTPYAITATNQQHERRLADDSVRVQWTLRHLCVTKEAPAEKWSCCSRGGRRYALNGANLELIERGKYFITKTRHKEIGRGFSIAATFQYASRFLYAIRASDAEARAFPFNVAVGLDDSMFAWTAPTVFIARNFPRMPPTYRVDK